jgi:crotonobetainyl-CoA:carnitine CoA-transferase CaiB-like acyl-CoA transferase
MNGVVRSRAGNRRRGYLQGVYPTSVEDSWVAVSVRDDTDRSQLVAVLGRPDLHDPKVDHDVFDEIVGGWTRTRTPGEIVETLQAQKIPAEQVITCDQMYDGYVGAQLDVRGYYEELEHPITGAHRYPGWPFRISPAPERHHRTGSPTLGQHNDEILRNLGLSDDEVAALRAERVIGERVLNA